MMRSILSVVGLLAWAGVSQAAVLPLVHTGAGGAANGSIDPNWTVGGPISGATYVIADEGQYPFPAWLGSSPGSASQWISVAPGPESSPVGTYTFRTTLDLTGLDPSTTVVSGRWAADKTGHIAVNGVALGFDALGGTNPYPEGFHDWTNFNLAGVFAPGVNTIDFVVDNVDHASPVGLRVELSGSASAGGQQTPEPASLLVFGLVAGAGAWRRRRAVAA